MIHYGDVEGAACGSWEPGVITFRRHRVNCPLCLHVLDQMSEWRDDDRARSRVVAWCAAALVIAVVIAVISAVLVK